MSRYVSLSRRKIVLKIVRNIVDCKYFEILCHCIDRAGGSGQAGQAMA